MRRMLCGLLPLLLAAACAAVQTQPPAAPNAGAPAYRAARSWMSPAAKKDKLLYVSTYSFAYGSSVYVLSYPSLALVGQLSTGALGMCTDKNGNIYMATYGGFEILEYAHGGTTPIKTLADSNGLSYGCSVDPKTGNLAVTNLDTFNSSQFLPGNILIYPNASGAPTTYRYGNIALYYFCAYDPHGNLFVDGQSSSDSFALAELRKRGGSGYFESISLDRSIGIPGGVQWKGRNLVIGDQGDENGSQAIYEFSIAGSQGTETGSTPLTGAGDVAQFWVEGKNAIVPDIRNWNVSLYPYPAGGNPTKDYSFGTDRNAFGAVVSVAPSRQP